MNAVEIGPGNMLDLIRAAIDRGAKDGDVFTVKDGDGNEQTVTLGHSVPTLGGRMNLVTVVREKS